MLTYWLFFVMALVTASLIQGIKKWINNGYKSRYKYISNLLLDIATKTIIGSMLFLVTVYCIHMFHDPEGNYVFAIVIAFFIGLIGDRIVTTLDKKADSVTDSILNYLTKRFK